MPQVSLLLLATDSHRVKTLLLLQKKTNSNLAQVGKLFHKQLHSLIREIESEFLSQKARYTKQHIVFILDISSIVFI